MQINTSSTAGIYVQTGDRQLQMSLKHTEVAARISGNLARVEVKQNFENPFNYPLEAIYVFPLPEQFGNREQTGRGLCIKKWS